MDSEAKVRNRAASYSNCTVTVIVYRHNEDPKSKHFLKSYTNQWSPMWYAAAHHHTDAIRVCCTSHNLPKINKTSQLQCEWHTQMWSLQWMIFYAVRRAYIRRPVVQLWLFPDVLSVFIQFVCSHVSFGLNIFVWYGSSTPSWNELQTVVQSYSCLLTHLRPYISLDTLSQKTQQVM